MRKTAIVYAALLLLAPGPSLAESVPYFRMGSGMSTDATPPAAGGNTAPAVAYNGWSGTPSVGNGPVGFFQARGLAAPVMFEASPGLPPGITLSSDGTLQGSFSTTGSYRSTVTATGADGKAAAAPYTVTVRRGALAIRLAQVPPLVAGVRTVVTPEVTNGSPSAWSLAGAPDWASVGTDGAVTLLPPPGAEPASFLLQASDPGGDTAVASSGPVTVADPVLGPGNLPSGMLEGSPFFGALSSNLPQAAYALVSGPAWLGVSPAGALSGYAPDVSVGTDYPLVLRASQAGATAELSTSLHVDPASVVVAAIPAVLRGGAHIRAAVTSGFGGAGTYAVRNNPGWLSVSPTGDLVGTVPNVTGSYAGITVRATMNGAVADSAPFGLSVTPSSASATAPPKARQGTAFQVGLATDLSGGSWAWSGTAQGLALAVGSDGATVTAPTAAGQVTYPLSFTYSAPDGAATAQASVVTYPDLVVTTTAQGSIALGVGDAASYGTSTGNAIGTVTYALLKDGTVSNGALAACGFTFDTQSGGLSTGATQACSVTGLSIRATDPGNPTYPQTAQAKDTAGSFAVSVSTPNAQDVTPISGTVAPVSAFWVSSSARVSGTPYSTGWGPSAYLNACNNGATAVYVYDFGRKVAARSVNLAVYAAGGGQMPLVIKYSNDNKTWTKVASLNPYYQSNYQWVGASGSWGSSAARYWALFYEGYCGSTNGYMTQFRLSN